MAEEKENIIIIEEEKQSNKKIYILIAVLIAVLIMLLSLLLVIIIKKKKQTAPNINVNEIVKKLEKKHISKDRLKILIKKADILYKSGKKQEALSLLEKISNYSEALSLYNLGVIQLEEKNYKKALNYFQKAIQNNDSRALSAINAAFCSLMLKNKKLFDYYKNLAYLYLPELAKNKNYPYYYALVMYYNGYEYETIPALKKPTDYDNSKLLAAVYEYFNDSLNAQSYEKNPFYKGLDYAQSGEYTLAKEYLSKSDLPKAEFALSLVELKLHEYKNAAVILKKYKYNNIYPVYMFLKPSLFDVKTAQKNFKNSFLAKKSDYYDLFFYYAPYKVLNMNQTIEFLKKGISGIPLGAIEESKTALSKSAFFSKLNLQISKAIKLAINGHIFLANQEFQKLYKKRKDSYVINYNLGLTDAQLGKYKEAYFHLLKAYHLNSNDLTSGILALFAGEKENIQNPYLVASIKDDLNANTKLQSAMLSIYTNNTVRMAAFLENEKNTNSPLWLISYLTAKALFDKDYTPEAIKLKNIFENDFVSQILYFYAQNKNLPVNKIAEKFHSFFPSIIPDLNDFFYGTKISRDYLFEFARISGLMEQIKEILLKKAKNETFDIIPVLKRLAFALFFTKNFEESYTIYNDLINNKNINDPRTLYYGAVAAVGAGHHANAVALMELAKLKNPSFFESRYALGLLWQETGNLNAASIQYAKIPTGFESKFFDFNIQPPE